MGQRSQFYVSFPLRDRNEERESNFLGLKPRNLSAFHLQWCWGWFMLQRAKQLLSFIQGNIENSSYSAFVGNSFDDAEETRQTIYNLTEFNFESKTICKGHDLVKSEIAYQIDKMDDEKWDDYMIRVEKTLKDKSIKKVYKIDPFQQDNNDGFLVIKIEDDGQIKYAFDRCYNSFKPLTAEQYYYGANYVDEDGIAYSYATSDDDFDNEDRIYVKELVNYIDNNNFKLLTKEELEEMFNQEYEY